MKFDDRFKQIINEWRYTDDPARDYDEYEKEERERLETEFIKENIAKNTSSYNVSFIPFQNDYKIIVNGPLFFKQTLMCAPKTPVCTFMPAFSICFTNISKSLFAPSAPIAAAKLGLNP